MSLDAAALASFDENIAPITYRRSESVTFRKTAERWGGLSNMAAGFPLVVNGVAIRTSEAIYQACRFPHRPEVLQLIIAQASPMATKMKAKLHRADSRRDFDALRVPIMWWSLRVKLACNPATFKSLLLATDRRPIVEDSHSNALCGAVPAKSDPHSLVGRNVPGRLLSLLRDALEHNGLATMEEVPPPAVAGFLLYGEPIATVIGLAPSGSIGQDPPYGGASSGRRPSAATPADVGTFTCSRCFLVCHPSQLAPSRNGEKVCRDCAT
jgi:type I restriction enzyme, S subunit